MVGKEFTVILTVPDLHPADNLVVELTGPADQRVSIADGFTVLKSRPDRHKPRDRDGGYFLRGPIPKDAPTGVYHLTRVTLIHTIGGRASEDFPEEQIPPLRIIVEPFAPSEPPPLPKITGAR